MSGYEILNAILALLFVLGLILGLAALMKKTGGIGPFRLDARERGRRRLAVLETLALDGRHKLLLVRSDEHEHLLVLGPGAPLELASPKKECP